MTSAAEATIPGLDVSRETLAALQQFEQLVRRWNSAINLVSKSTLSEIWPRHILDSTQIFSLCPPNAVTWADFGSGGGFPGIVVAILAAQLKPDLRVTLVESDLRKATFLRQAAQTLAPAGQRRGRDLSDPAAPPRRLHARRGRGRAPARAGRCL